MNKNDYIVMIIEHNVTLGIKDNDNFVYYITEILPNMSMQALAYELEDLQELLS